MWKGVAVGVMLLAAGCTYMAEEADRVYAARCEALGLEPGGERFVQCLEEQRSQDQLESRRIRQLRQDLLPR